MLLRTPFVILLGLICFPMGISSASASTAEEARMFVDNMGKKVLATLNAQAPDAQKHQQLRQLFSENVDMDWMGRFVLGRAWSQANEDQRSRYLQAYKEYLLARYTTNFADYAGSRYSITGVRGAADRQFIVAMDVKTPQAGQQDVQAGYRVHTGNGGQFRIIDIIIEGVSLITTERSEFASIVQNGGMDKLIEQLGVKAQAAAS